MSVLSSLVKISCTGLTSITGFQQKYGDKAADSACNLVEALYEGNTETSKPKDSSTPESSGLFSSLSNLGGSFLKSAGELFSLTPNNESKNSDSSKESSSGLFSALSGLGKNIFQSAKDIIGSAPEKPDPSKLPSSEKDKEQKINLAELEAAIKDLSNKMKDLSGGVTGLSDNLKTMVSNFSKGHENGNLWIKIKKIYDKNFSDLLKKYQKLSSMLEDLSSRKTVKKSERDKYNKKLAKYNKKLSEVNFLISLMHKLSK